MPDFRLFPTFSDNFILSFHRLFSAGEAKRTDRATVGDGTLSVSDYRIESCITVSADVDHAPADARCPRSYTAAFIDSTFSAISTQSPWHRRVSVMLALTDVDVTISTRLK